MCIKQHCNVLVSCLQSDGQGIALILKEETEDDMDEKTKEEEENKQKDQLETLKIKSEIKRSTS